MHCELTIDGQQMFLLGDEEWNAALHDGVWGELPLCSSRDRAVAEAMLWFTRAHRDAFQLALCRDGLFAKSWTVINLLATQHGWQRVHVERVRCDACGVTQMIANPTVADLYLSVKDWANVMKRATADGAVCCVRCGEKLPRFAIWAEIIENEQEQHG